MTDLAPKLKLLTDDTGQDIAEYAVMLAVILVLVVGTMRLVVRILVGAAGLVLPFLPGTVLLLTGVILLSQHYNWARQLLARCSHQISQRLAVD